MRIWLISLTLAAFLGLAPSAQAHVGDEIYPFFELLDEDLDRIDLTDGSVEDWLEVIGEPSLSASDFFWGYDESEYDPSQVDFRIWLAWNQSTSTVWIAMERFDDLYFNLYDGDEPWEMQLWDSSIRFFVDGDHTGGKYSYLLGRSCEGCTAEQVLQDFRQAQQWMVLAETPDGEHLFISAPASGWPGNRTPRLEAASSARARRFRSPNSRLHLRRHHLRRRGRLGRLAALPWQDHRVRDTHDGQRRHPVEGWVGALDPSDPDRYDGISDPR